MKRYTLAVTSPEYWSEIHNALIVDSNQDGIPDRKVVCSNCEEHSLTRGTYELTEEEVEEIRTHPHVKWIELSPADNPDSYPKPELATKRFKKSVYNIRRPFAFGYVTGFDFSANLHRTNQGVGRPTVRYNSELYSWPDYAYKNHVGRLDEYDASYQLSGKNVDIVISDSGILQYHPEFLDDNGQSRVLDIILDGPYVIDPDYFNTNNLTYTKADGRVGIGTTASHDWWTNSSSRSPEFSAIGTLSYIPSGYTVEHVLGATTDGISSISNYHGTSVAALAAGRYYGNAFEANIWNVTIVDYYSDIDIDLPTSTSHDAVKIFHKHKPINPETGKKNPTIVNCSWGFKAYFVDNISNPRTFDYRFLGIGGTVAGHNDRWTVEAQNQGITGIGITACMLGLSGGWSTSSGSYANDDAGNEMMAEGVILVCSAGNHNQRLTIGLDDPHRLDCFSYNPNFTVGRVQDGDHRTEIFPAGTMPLSNREWLHPHGLGYDKSNEFHPVICVGGQGSATTHAGAETLYYFTNNGPGVDVFAPTDWVVSAGGTGNQTNGTWYPGYNYFHNCYWTGKRVDDERFYDTPFGGTSAAAPVATGVIALHLEANPDADSRAVKNWIYDNSTVLGIDTVPDKFSGTGIEDALLSQFNDYYSAEYWMEHQNLRDAVPRILYNPYARDESPSIENVEIEGIDFSY